MKNVLLVGCGRIAGLNEDDLYRKKPCSHIGAYQAHPAYDVKGVYDINPKSCETFANKFGILGRFNNIEKALSEIKPELVSIAVPYDFNCEIVHLVAQHPNRPKMIFCEKPISNSLKNAENMVRVCEENKVLFYINNRRLTDIYNKLEEIYHRELDGEAITVNAWCSSGLHAIGIHMIDLLRKIFGDIEWVRAKIEKEKVNTLPYSTNFKVDDPRVNAHIAFKNGIIGNFFNTALTTFTYFELEVLCRKGKIRVSDNGNILELYKTRTPSRSTLSYSLVRKKVFKTQNAETLFAKIAKELVHSNYDDCDHPLSAKHGLESYRVLDALIRSSESEKTVWING